MMAGMAYELEARWRRDNDVTAARESINYRAALAARESRGPAARRTRRPRLLERLVASFQASTGARPAAR